MSIKVCIYVPSLSKEVIPIVASRFSDFGMACQFHPQFALNASKDSGLLSLRLRVLGDDVSQYENVDMLSSFEIAFKDYRYTSPVSVNPTINVKLKDCTKVVVVRMHANPTSSLRAGLYFASFLAEASAGAGIIYTPRSDQYLEPEQALDQLAQEVKTYEAELPLQDWIIVPFRAWTTND